MSEVVLESDVNNEDSMLRCLCNRPKKEALLLSSSRKPRTIPDGFAHHFLPMAIVRKADELERPKLGDHRLKFYILSEHVCMCMFVINILKIVF